MPNELLHVTDAVLWRGTALLAAIDAVLVPLTARAVPADRFRRMRGRTIAISAIFWAALWLWAVTFFWGSVYQFCFPHWSRWLLPLAMGAFFGLAAAIIFSLALRSPSLPSLVFVLLGAMLGPLTHVVAVLRGVVEKPPMLHGASPLAAVVISCPEFCLYWCVVLLIARAAVIGRTGRHR